MRPIVAAEADVRVIGRQWRHRNRRCVRNVPRRMVHVVRQLMATQHCDRLQWCMQTTGAARMAIVIEIQLLSATGRYRADANARRHRRLASVARCRGLRRRRGRMQ